MRTKKKKSKYNIKCEEIKVLYVKEYAGKNKTVLRIVRWGNDKPVIENRRFYFTIDYDEWRPMRVAPIGINEWKILIENKEEIEKLLYEE